MMSVVEIQSGNGRKQKLKTENFHIFAFDFLLSKIASAEIKAKTFLDGKYRRSF